MSARKELADALAAKLPDSFRIVAEPREVQVDDAGVTLLQIVRRTIKPLPEAPLGHQLADVDLWVVSPYTDPEQAEDPLDEATDTVLEALDSYGWIVWSIAERTQYRDTWPAYKITATLTTHTTEEGS